MEFPQFVTFISADVGHWIDADSNYVFDIGTLDPGECGTIRITDIVDCVPGITGLTQCTKVWILPANECVFQLDHYDKWLGTNPVLVVEGECIADTVVFVISNIGLDMQGNSNYRLFADGLLYTADTFSLQANDSLVITIPGNGPND